MHTLEKMLLCPSCCQYWYMHKQQVSNTGVCMYQYCQHDGQSSKKIARLPRPTLAKRIQATVLGHDGGEGAATCRHEYSRILKRRWLH